MDFVTQLFTNDSPAHTIMVFGVVVSAGLALGSIRIFGVSLGPAGVLFSGLFFSNYGLTVNSQITEFIREFGLILFVYTIGLQVGPGFFDSLKREGMPLNLMAAFVVIAGLGITILLILFAQIPPTAAAGIFAGATTSTPSLAAIQQALKEIPGIVSEIRRLPALGYAVSYPFSIIGVILTMVAVRLVFRINVSKETEALAAISSKSMPQIEEVALKVQNRSLHGLTIKKIPDFESYEIIISRVMHEGSIQIAFPKTKIHIGDILHIVGARENLEKFQTLAGERVVLDASITKGVVTTKRIVVTKHNVVGKSIGELDIRNRYRVTVTRVSRSDIEFTPTPDIKLFFGDTLLAVGEESSVQKFASDMGDAPGQLDHPHLIPVFLGICIGVILGSWPIHLPGMPVSMKLGLACGPLLVAIVLSRIGRIGNIIWYMPISANFMLREVGLTIFLACIGLRSGAEFVKTLTEGSGLYWIACSGLVALVPIVIIALFARLKMKMNYLPLCGLLAGSMTDLPALVFVNKMTRSSVPLVTYATVYPLVMILRVISAQTLVVLFCR